MTANSRDQYRDGHRKTAHGNELRWTGHLYALIQNPGHSTILVGQWWDPEPAEHWAQTYMKRHPTAKVQIIEAEFKDFYIPHRHLGNTQEVITRGDIL